MHKDTGNPWGGGSWLMSKRRGSFCLLWRWVSTRLRQLGCMACLGGTGADVCDHRLKQRMSLIKVLHGCGYVVLVSIFHAVSHPLNRLWSCSI